MWGECEVKKQKEITARELSEQIKKLKITEKQREFIKAAFRTMIAGALEDRFGCKVDI